MAQLSPQEIRKKCFEAAISGSSSKLREMLDMVAKEENKSIKEICDTMVSHQGYTLLHHAAIKGHLHIVRQLINIKMNLDIKTWNGDTALALAVLSQQLNIVRYLSMNGASVNTANYFSLSPIHLVTFIKARGEDPHEKAKENFVDQVLRHLVQKDHTLVNALGCYGTPLYYAVYNGNEKAVETLLDCNADVNLTISVGLSPLALAIKMGFKSIMNSLLEKEADPDIGCTSLLMSPLHVASTFGDRVAIESLLAKNANPRLPDMFGLNPMERAIFCGNYDAAAALRSSCADFMTYVSDGEWQNEDLWIVAITNHLYLGSKADERLDLIKSTFYDISSKVSGLSNPIEAINWAKTAGDFHPWVGRSSKMFRDLCKRYINLGGPYSIHMCRQYIDLYPKDSSTGHTLLSQAYLANKQYQNSRKSCEEALKKNGDDPKLKDLLSVIDDEAKKYGESQVVMVDGFTTRCETSICGVEWCGHSR